MRVPRAAPLLTLVRSDRSGQLLVASGGLLAFVMLGWTSLLMPSMIRDIERDLAVGDADMGTAYLLASVAFTVGCLFTGWLTPRVGRRAILVLGAGLGAAGCVAALLPSWPLFLAAAIGRGFGSGIIEVAVQGLFLAAFTGRAQGRAINMVHFCFSLGAALAPVVIAAAIGARLTWPGVMALSAVPWIVSGVLLAVAPMDTGRIAGNVPAARLRPGLPLVAGALGIAFYVGSEAGISSWLVRFLEAAPLEVAASALTLFWAALAVSRLVVARFGHHLAPEAVSIVGFVVAAVAVVAAVLAPTVELQIALFGVAGFAYGPVYAGIILLGARIPGRADAVTGVLASSGVFGSAVYPPVMGLLSLGPGLGVAMAGTALLSIAGAVVVAASARSLGGIRLRGERHLDAAEAHA